MSHTSKAKRGILVVIGLKATAQSRWYSMFSEQDVQLPDALPSGSPSRAAWYPTLAFEEVGDYNYGGTASNHLRGLRETRKGPLFVLICDFSCQSR